MTEFQQGDRVRCIKTIYAGPLPSILVGNIGTILAHSRQGPFPVIVFWDASIMSKEPYKCYVREDEIEIFESGEEEQVEDPEKIYSEPLSGV